MKEYRTDFCSFFRHDNGILEIVVDEGIEVDDKKTQQFLDTIAAIEPKVELALVNRINKYSYTFKANMMLASARVVPYVAVVNYKRPPWPLSGVFFPKFYNLAFFGKYQEAEQWLLGKTQRKSA
ncbi:MAG: hypothetical protein OEZ10_09920 [Gammaproteobacteria bacterium]|nr:hypothetical protein [Gammaproteobacteria bacterium]